MVFNVEPKKLLQLAPRLERVMVIDPNPASARLIADLMKDLGARYIVQGGTTIRALEMLYDIEPQLIFIELAGPSLDGVEFTKALRRSVSKARKAPVIMVTAEATAATIIGARDAGVHEFLRKPFTAGDLFRRVDNVATKDRPWIEAKMYVGPDRRRFNSGEYEGPKKRGVDKGVQDKAA